MGARTAGLVEARVTHCRARLGPSPCGFERLAESCRPHYAVEVMTQDTVLAAALELPTRERAELAARLLESLDESTDELTEAEWEAAWTSEAQHRLAQLDSGEVEAVPLKDALAQIRAELKRRRDRAS